VYAIPYREAIQYKAFFSKELVINYLLTGPKALSLLTIFVLIPKKNNKSTNK
tara:strand:- start:391 stop:546 length:156 start_codon:yes stop_codon:yes gene_type:complete